MRFRLQVTAAVLSALATAVLAAAQNAAPQPPATTLPNASASPSVAPATAIVLPNASASPVAAPPALDTKQALENIGNLVKDGKIGIEADLLAGKMPVIPKYLLEVEGSPTTTIDVNATNGKVDNFKFGVKNGRLIVRGQGLRPRLWIEGLSYQDPTGLTEFKLHGIGIWRPIIAVFGGIARAAVRKLPLRTDVPSVMKGEIIGARKEPAASPTPAPSPTPPPTETPAPGPAPAPTPSFMDLVREVRINEMVVTAWPGKPMNLRPFVSFQTAAQPRGGEAMKVSVEKGIFRPGHDGAPNFMDFHGHLDGEIENGDMSFQENSCSIAHGEIRKGEFEAKSGDDGKLLTELSAATLAFELSSGKFSVPGGMNVELDAGSTFQVDRLTVTSAGVFSGVAKIDIAGKTGELSRSGATISASDIKVKTQGLKIVENKATGPVQVTFDYKLEYPFEVKYPIKEIPVKKLDLDFHGPFAVNLKLDNAGKDTGEVTGTYVFKAPWDPIEQAALVVLEAKWQQDLAVKNVDFAITPKMFRPCGETCFTLGIEVTAEKRSSTNRLKKLFSQFCAPVGRANLFIDKPARAFVLKDVKIETHCKGIVGWFVNFLTPFLTKTYGEMKLFQMPPDLPLTVDSVRGGAHLVEIGGSIDYNVAQQAKPKVPPEPQPVVVEPEKPPGK
jgi:hypothetical protein